MTPEALEHNLRRQPFQPFRIVLTEGGTHEVRHPELLWIGQNTAYVGLTADAAQTFFERSVRIDLSQITAIEPLEK